MSLEEKILKYKQIQEQVKRLEEEKQHVYKEILQSFSQDEKEVFSANYRVKRYFRMTIKTTVDEARNFQATRTEEIVDKEKIKELVHSGIFVPNVTESAYFFIYSLKSKEEDPAASIE